ncbi:hypothetical protein ACHAPJ_009837 [Fusarium lateritium]
MPVPWSRFGPTVLTTDLALWWLCMLAMSAHHHRAIMEEENVARINQWDTIYHSDERGWVRRHQYSGFEEPCHPLSAPAYQTPSPTNVAAFEATTGLNANEWFNAFDSTSLSWADLSAHDTNMTTAVDPNNVTVPDGTVVHSENFGTS